MLSTELPGKEVHEEIPPLRDTIISEDLKKSPKATE
jgi:hypothetical protein